jgi:Cu/Zn superoxide dismutase
MYALRAALAAVALAAISSAAAGADPATLQVKLYAENRPGETGMATFELVPSGVKVVVRMAGQGNGREPIHIHEGTCKRLNLVPKYHLTDLLRGISTTTIPGITSSADMTKYVACAEIATP